jgi:serine/threonine-protein kinase PknG
MSRCDRPGCGGTLEDGYCTTCGLAPLGAGGVAAAEPARLAEAVAAPAGTRPGGPPGSATTPTTGSASTTASSRSTGSTRSGSTRSTRRALGGGAIGLPPLPPQDPLATLVPGVVPDRRRFCSSCGTKLSRDAGFCPKCGQEYSFVPALQPDEVIAGKYQIKGTIAFGGLGWIYLAFDTLLSRWVVLKGLLNSKDPGMVALAVKEREFLAAVKHRSIVGIYDFVTSGREGYIVMEYVNGKTLMTLRREHGGPLPPLEAISYILDVLPAFDYLDRMGLVYCDFKPENAMVEGDTVKLIDMGAVRRVDDLAGDVYGSKGYSAPEADDLPTPVSDLYTVGRTLAVLLADFAFQSSYERTLPPAGDVPVFRQHESLYRFLQKATRPAADERFQTAEEMAEQLLGVLRDVAAGTVDVGRVRSSIFDDDDLRASVAPATAGDAVTLWDLPALKLDPQDPAAGAIMAAAGIADPERRRQAFARAAAASPESGELPYLTVNALIELGAFDEAEQRLAKLESAGARDWRTAWYRGRLWLAQGQAEPAAGAFDAVFGELPGELAPKLALGMAYELAGDLDRAIHYYDTVSLAERSAATAALGLARCLERRGDREGAAAAFQRVASGSSRYVRAQMGLAQVLLAARSGPPGAPELARAAGAIEGLRGSVDRIELHRLSAELLRIAAGLVEAGAVPPSPTATVLGVPLQASELRLGAEQELRACARFATGRRAKVRFVDDANRVRPLTIF